MLAKQAETMGACEVIAKTITGTMLLSALAAAGLKHIVSQLLMS